MTTLEEFLKEHANSEEALTLQSILDNRSTEPSPASRLFAKRQTKYGNGFARYAAQLDRQIGGER